MTERSVLSVRYVTALISPGFPTSSPARGESWLRVMEHKAVFIPSTTCCSQELLFLSINMLCSCQIILPITYTALILKIYNLIRSIDADSSEQLPAKFCASRDSREVNNQGRIYTGGQGGVYGGHTGQRPPCPPNQR